MESKPFALREQVVSSHSASSGPLSEKIIMYVTVDSLSHMEDPPVLPSWIIILRCVIISLNVYLF